MARADVLRARGRAVGDPGAFIDDRRWRILGTRRTGSRSSFRGLLQGELGAPWFRELGAVDVWETEAVNRWHDTRASRLEGGIAPPHASCGVESLVISCSSCGVRHEVPDRCSGRFCWPCQARFFHKLRRKLIRSTMAHLRELAGSPARVRVRRCKSCGKNHPEHARGRSRVQLWTLTVRHASSASETRALISKAWARLRARLWKELGRAIPFALVWEWTESIDGSAHVHAHVLALAPPLCFKVLSRWWKKATGGQSGGIGHGNARERSKRGASSALAAARYIAKYATKGSAVLEGEEPNPALLAEVWASGYGMRRVTASRGFWVAMPAPLSRCCSAPWTFEGSASELATAEALAFGPRGPPLLN